MTEEIIVAGFGGQGVLLAGKMLAVAAMREGKHVSHIPSYGAEMRGGTANCSVVISQDEIASPAIEKPTVVIALNEPSMKKFAPRMAAGGLMLINRSLINTLPERQDLQVLPFDFTEIARDRGTDKAANMVAIGKLIKEKPEICSLEGLIRALDEAVTIRNRRFNPINEKAIRSGFDL